MTKEVTLYRYWIRNGRVVIEEIQARETPRGYKTLRHDVFYKKVELDDVKFHYGCSMISLSPDKKKEFKKSIYDYYQHIINTYQARIDDLRKNQEEAGKARED